MKSIFYKLFKIGKLHKSVIPQINQEGVLLVDEGISAWVNFKNFRAPGKRYSRRTNYTVASIVLTKKHFLAFSGKRPIIGIAWNDGKIKSLNITKISESIFSVCYNANTFNEDWSGEVTVKFKSQITNKILQKIKTKVEENFNSGIIINEKTK